MKAFLPSISISLRCLSIQFSIYSLGTCFARIERIEKSRSDLATNGTKNFARRRISSEGNALLQFWKRRDPEYLSRCICLDFSLNPSRKIDQRFLRKFSRFPWKERSGWRVSVLVRSNAETLGEKRRGSQSGWSLSPHMAAGKVINNAHRPPAYSPLHNDRERTKSWFGWKETGEKPWWLPIFSLGWVSRLLSLFVIVIVRLLSFLFALASNNGISSKGSKDSPFVVVDFDKRKKEDLD